MGHRLFEAVTLRGEPRMHRAHGWDRIPWCRTRDEGLDHVVYGETLPQKPVGRHFNRHRHKGFGACPSSRPRASEPWRKVWSWR
jgi:hypothetical protein